MTENLLYKFNSLAEIYTLNEDTFNVGILVSESDNYAIYISIDEEGKKDGLFFIRKDYISDLCYETEYLRKIECYMNYWLKKESSCQQHTYTSLRSAIESATSENKIISVICSSDLNNIITGYVSQVSTSHICIQSIDIDSAALSEEDPENIAVKDIIFFEIDSVDNLLLDYACKILY